MDDLRTLARTRLNAGLRDLWYPVAASWQVGEAPFGMTRLGEKIVVWRDADGAVHALEDRCPHRGARLSMGWNLGDRVACWYHGVEVDTAGRMAAVPAIGRCEVEKRARNRTYPATERAGAIWLWFGNDDAAPAELTLPAEVCGGEWEAILCTAQWDCNYRYAAENVMDPMHGAYLHAVSHSMAEVRRLCSRAIWIEDGRIRSQGEPNEVIRVYQRALLVEKDDVHRFSAGE